MLVFSTYPLNSANQSWTYPFFGEGQRWQFPSDNAEGVYNATLALLGKPEQMLEYSRPFVKLSAGPPLWVSIVGNDDFWPVAYMETRDKGMPRYRAESRPRPKLPILLASALYPRPFLIGFLLLSLFSMTACLSLLEVSPVLPISRFFGRFFSAWGWLPTSLSTLSGDAVISGNRPTRRTMLFQYATILFVLYAIIFFYYLLPCRGHATVSLISSENP
jgi:hypothetical protein